MDIIKNKNNWKVNPSTDNIVFGQEIGSKKNEMNCLFCRSQNFTFWHLLFCEKYIQTYCSVERSPLQTHDRKQKKHFPQIQNNSKKLEAARSKNLPIGMEALIFTLSRINDDL